MRYDDTKLERIRQKADALNRPEAIAETMLSRQERLNALKEKHGMTAVSVASGLTESTLGQYLRVKNPMTIGESAVLQAERILEDF